MGEEYAIYFPTLLTSYLPRTNKIAECNLSTEESWYRQEMLFNLHSVNRDTKQELVKNQIRIKIWLRYQIPIKLSNVSKLLKSNKNQSNSTFYVWVGPQKGFILRQRSQNERCYLWLQDIAHIQSVGYHNRKFQEITTTKNKQN